MRRFVKVAFCLFLATSMAACSWVGASEAPKCSDDEIEGAVLGQLFEDAGITSEGDKVSFMFGGEIDRPTFDEVVSVSIQHVREREYKPANMKRYCMGEVAVEIDSEKFQKLEVHKTQKGAWVGISALGASSGSTNYSIQITDDGSTFVTVGD